MRVYLAGAIFGEDDVSCRVWRDGAAELLRNLGHEAVDPLRRDYRGREAMHVEEIVALDEADIRECDAVIVKADRPGWGTAMELYFARSIGVPVVAWGVQPPCSPWLMHCVSEFVDTVDQAIAVTIRRYAA